MRTLWLDVHHGVRTLLKSPRFTLVAIMTLALGIGASTAIFSVVNGVLLRPLPYDEPNRLLLIQEATTGDGYGISYPNFLDVRELTASYEKIGVFSSTHLTLTADGEIPARLSGATVSANLFELLGATPQIGRSFRPDEDQRGGGSDGRPLILSYALWQSRFGGETQVLGRLVTLDNLPFTVIGVMPEGFQYPVQNEPVEVWTTVAFDAEPALYGGTIPTSRGYPHYDGAVARLKPGVTPRQAQAEADAIAAALRKQHNWLNDNWKLKATPALERIVGEVRPALVMLLGAVGLVLLIACANVANLLLVRATKRQKEVAVRTALGASRWRIARQLLTEGLILSVAAGGVGLLLALWGVDLLTALIPEEVPRVAEIGLDWRVTCFAIATSLLTGIVFGLAPALKTTRINLTVFLKEGGRSGADGSPRSAKLRHAIVVGEVALALVLLTGAGLLLQSFVRLRNVQPGFDPSHLLTFRVSLPESSYAQGSRQVADFYQNLVERLEEKPGVRSVSVAQALPLSGRNNSTSLDLEGHPPAAGQRQSTDLRFIGLNYFRTMMIPLTKGRDFDVRDDKQTSEKAIINEAFARKFYGTEDPVGRRVTLGFGGSGPKEIVGVVGDVKHRGLGEETRPEVYVPLAQFPINSLTIFARTADDPHALIASARQEVLAIDKNLPIYDVKTLTEYFAQSIAQPRFNSLLLLLFAGIALILASVGLYALIAYSVAQRTHEIGVRMALGARGEDVLRLVVGQGMRLVAIGVAVGLIASFALARVMTSLLYGVSATDPLTFGAVAALLTAVALVACYVPARRATKVDPLVALRYE